ncbi:unnamed protein product [Owenia fusiformis]|uniref:Multidrug and toxin extrusion protein n=1 Tax=Owenia fusiformis TaxID=6347 RepID=A0A8J1TG78_OWEFU|nr:unnamed protein product [Owenia fusiformis]
MGRNDFSDSTKLLDNDLPPHGQAKRNGTIKQNGTYTRDIQPYTSSVGSGTFSTGGTASDHFELPRTKMVQGCCGKVFKHGYWDEFKEVLKLAWPVIITQLWQMLIAPISLVFCGHLGKIELDAVALANTMINVFGISIGTGLATACDTLFSQAYGGNNKKMVGVYLQRSLLMIFLGAVVLVPLHLNAEGLLRAIGQDHQVAKGAGEYLLIFIPGLFINFLYQVITKYLQNQNIVFPSLFIGAIANVVNAVLHYVVIYVWNFGIQGSAVVQVISYGTMLLLHIIYILVSKIYVETWGGWTLDAFQHWGTYMKLAIPGMLMICIEWWSFEIGTFLTGILGLTQQGTQSIVMQIDGLVYNIPLGLGIACSIRVGQYLGSDLPSYAVQSFRVCTTMVWVCSITVGLIFVSLRFYIPRAFTDDNDVIEISANLLPIIALYQFFDGNCAVAQGAIRGSGRQLPGAIAMFIGYYIIALPIGIPLMFLTNLRAAGLWWGLTLGLILVSSTLVLIVCFTNWDNAAKQAQERGGVMTDDDTMYNQTTILDTDKSSETTALLSNKERSFEQSGNSIRSNRLNRQFSTSYTVENAPIDLEKLEHTGELTNAALLCRRGITVLICLFIVGIGVLIRLVVKYPEELTMLCVPWDGKGPLPNTTMPICNVTMETTTIFPNMTKMVT